jgi:AcrR family transcriptional regulator
MSAETRDRIIDASIDLFRLHGYAGTGMKQIVTSSGAPFGSVYHFFPGGKGQLAEAAIERAGEYYEALVLAILESEDDIVAGVRAVFDGAAEVLDLSDYADACPIATVALEVASTSEPLRKATDRVFQRWFDALAPRLALAGVPAARARPLAIAITGLLEGGFLFSRAAKSTEPMTASGDAAAALVLGALGDGR